jgi:Arc/MetJ-type ribon-helix-helix transcriptional regulator
MSPHKKIAMLHIALSDCLDQAIEEAVMLGTHASKSELIREAIREKLKSMGFDAYPKTSTRRVETEQ